MGGTAEGGGETANRGAKRNMRGRYYQGICAWLSGEGYEVARSSLFQARFPYRNSMLECVWRTDDLVT